MGVEQAVELSWSGSRMNMVAECAVERAYRLHFTAIGREYYTPGKNKIVP